jgi:hypothetical protein
MLGLFNWGDPMTDEGQLGSGDVAHLLQVTPITVLQEPRFSRTSSGATRRP